MSIDTTLAERGARYGRFEEHAEIAQAIQDAYRIYPEKWDNLPRVVKQSFTVIADKIARTLNGDPMYGDNYHDIGGYAKLAEDWVNGVPSKGLVSNIPEVHYADSIADMPPDLQEAIVKYEESQIAKGGSLWEERT